MAIKWMTILAFFVISIMWIFYRGNRIYAKREKMLKGASNSLKMEELIFLTYHGGMPKIPKPQKLHLGLSGEYFLFFNDKGEQEKVFYECCNKVDKIVTRHIPDMKGRSVVLWGPFIGLFNKVKYKYYIVIEYKDSANNDNNILLECDQQNHRLLFERIKNKIKNINTKMRVALI